MFRDHVKGGTGIRDAQKKVKYQNYLERREVDDFVTAIDALLEKKIEGKLINWEGRSQRPVNVFQKMEGWSSLTHEEKIWLTNQYSTYLESKRVGLNFSIEIREGWDIIKTYPLIESCMTADSAKQINEGRKLVKIQLLNYLLNPDVRLVVIKGHDAIIGRALLWSIDGQEYLDRIYPDNAAPHIQWLEAEGKRRGWNVRSENSRIGFWANDPKVQFKRIKNLPLPFFDTWSPVFPQQVISETRIRAEWFDYPEFLSFETEMVDLYMETMSFIETGAGNSDVHLISLEEAKAFWERIKGRKERGEEHGNSGSHQDQRTFALIDNECRKKTPRIIQYL